MILREKSCPSVLSLPLAGFVVKLSIREQLDPELVKCLDEGDKLQGGIGLLFCNDTSRGPKSFYSMLGVRVHGERRVPRARRGRLRMDSGPSVGLYQRPRTAAAEEASTPSWVAFQTVEVRSTLANALDASTIAAQRR